MDGPRDARVLIEAAARMGRVRTCMRPVDAAFSWPLALMKSERSGSDQYNALDGAVSRRRLARSGLSTLASSPPSSPFHAVSGPRAQAAAGR